jgi:hypothetical protein
LNHAKTNMPSFFLVPSCRAGCVRLRNNGGNCVMGGAQMGLARTLPRLMRIHGGNRHVNTVRDHGNFVKQVGNMNRTQVTCPSTTCYAPCDAHVSRTPGERTPDREAGSTFPEEMAFHTHTLKHSPRNISHARDTVKSA